MASKGQMTGMQGVFLAAAELSRRGFIVSPTSRSAAGADLLVTDQLCRKAWSVQVKTNAGPKPFWLVSSHTAELKSPSHVYVFVGLRGIARPEFLVVSSEHVASKVREKVRTTGSIWRSFYRADGPTQTDDGWSIFGDPHAGEGPDIEEDPDADAISG